MNSHMVAALIKLLCFISTSAHTNYLINLLKSVAWKGLLNSSAACESLSLPPSQARCVFYSTPWWSQPFYLRICNKFSNKLLCFVIRLSHLKSHAFQAVKRTTSTCVSDRFRWLSQARKRILHWGRWESTGRHENSEVFVKKSEFEGDTPLNACRHLQGLLYSYVKTHFVSTLSAFSLNNKTAWRRFYCLCFLLLKISYLVTPVR